MVKLSSATSNAKGFNMILCIEHAINKNFSFALWALQHADNYIIYSGMPMAMTLTATST